MDRGTLEFQFAGPSAQDDAEALAEFLRSDFADWPARIAKRIRLKAKFDRLLEWARRRRTAGRQVPTVVLTRTQQALSLDEVPGRRHQFDYPIGWEAQLVIVEGDNRGFYVWADDARGRFKRLVVQRHRDGWQLTLVTINYAPFDGLTSGPQSLGRTRAAVVGLGPRRTGNPLCLHQSGVQGVARAFCGPDDRCTRRGTRPMNTGV